VVPAARGAQWILEGFRVFFMAPVNWIALALAFLFALIVLTSLKLVGALVCLVLYPAVIAAFMQVSRAVALRQPLDPRMLDAVRVRLRPLLAIGALYAVGVVLALLGSSLADDGALWRVLTRPPEAGAPSPIPAEARDGALVALVLYVPSFMLVLYSPMLVAWHEMPAAKAAFYSVAACILNWRAISIYILVGGLLGMLAANVALIMALALAGSAARDDPSLLLVAVSLSLFVMALPVVMASTHASYRDVFGAAEDA